jgi:uncharacterized repeat protein (TIGR03803 family)
MRCQALTIRLLLTFVAFTTAAFAASPKETVLYTFEDRGASPAGLVADVAGNLYGTAGVGGADVVYELSPPSQPGGSWTFTVIYAFQGGSDGAGALGPLVFDDAGNLYGATIEGGSPNCRDGCGTIFELSPPALPGGTWTESQLHVFQGSPTDGATPLSGVVFSNHGRLYGTTDAGGSGTCTSGNFGNGCGTVFELTPSANSSWTETVLHNFQGGTDGSQPSAGVAPDYAGNLYGTTVDGGSEETCPTTGRPGCGTIFELAVPSQPGGPWTEKVYSFMSNGSSNFNRDGMNPEGGLTIHEGAIYGTTFYGGTQGFGTIFQISMVNGKPTGTVLHTFGYENGYTHPAATMVVDSAGNLYGTTGNGACEGCDGTVFRIQPPLKSGGHWSYIELHGFSGGSDGGYPLGGVVILNDALYGTTSVGGDLTCNEGVGCGVVYSITAQ